MAVKNTEKVDSRVNRPVKTWMTRVLCWEVWVSRRMEPRGEGGSKQRFAGGSIVCHFAPEVLGNDSGGTYDFLRSVWLVLLVLGLWDTVIDLVVGLVDLIPVVVDITYPTRNLVGEDGLAGLLKFPNVSCIDPSSV